VAKRVAIIGAGPCGTAALRAFQSAKQNGEDIPETGVAYGITPGAPALTSTVSQYTVRCIAICGQTVLKSVLSLQIILLMNTSVNP